MIKLQHLIATQTQIHNFHKSVFTTFTCKQNVELVTISKKSLAKFQNIVILVTKLGILHKEQKRKKKKKPLNSRIIKLQKRPWKSSKQKSTHLWFSLLQSRVAADKRHHSPLSSLSRPNLTISTYTYTFCLYRSPISTINNGRFTTS